MAEVLRFVNPGAPSGGDGITKRITAQHTLDNADAVDKGGAEVGLPITGHSLIAGAEITITGTANYDQAGIAINSVTANEIVITDTFVEETFDGTETVDDDNVAYDSSSIWEAAEQTDLPTDTDTHRVKCAGTTADTTALVVTGWTTDATHFITIEGDRDQSDGFYDGTLQYSESHYRNEQSAAFICVNPKEGYTVVDGIQVKATKTGNFVEGIRTVTTGNVIIRNSRVTTTLSGTTRNGIRLIDSIGASVTTKVENCIVAGFVGTNSVGVLADLGSLWTGIVNIYNSTVYNCTIGIEDRNQNAAATTATKNNTLFNNTDDFKTSGIGTFTIDHCATEEGLGEGTNGQTISTPTDDMEDPENATTDDRDVRPKTGGVLDATGLPNSSDSEVPLTDIIGITRDASTPDIGAWEIVAAGGAPVGIVALGLQPFTMTVSGRMDPEGAAAPTLEVFGLNVVGAQTFEAGAAPILESLGLTVQGAMGPEGGVAPEFAGFALDVAGIHGAAAGTVAIELSTPSLATLGLLQPAGVAAPLMEPFTLAAGGAQDLPGIVAAELAQMALATGGVMLPAGTVAPALAALVLEVSGIQGTAQGIADLVMELLELNAQGVMLPSGMVAPELAGFDLTTQGGMAPAGTIAALLAEFDVTVSGVEAFTGAVALVLAPFVITVDGTSGVLTLTPIVIRGIRPLVASAAGFRPGGRDAIRPAITNITGVRDG